MRTSSAPAQVRLAAILDEPLAVDDVLAALDDAGDGGLTLFVGRVRDHDSERGVVGLDYSAHPTAEARLAEVCDEVAAQHPQVRLAAIHRVGTLAVGDVAVVVGAASAHRDAAFAASRALIDLLKQRVPIWKHQRFADGTEEWVDHA